MVPLRHDLKLAWRALTARGHRAVTATAVVALGIGIGATAAVFSVVDGLLFRPLPYPDAGQVVTVSESRGERDGAESVLFAQMVSGPNLDDIRSASRSFESLSAYRYGLANVAGDGPAEVLIAAYLDPVLWRTLGAGRPDGWRPAAGQMFDAETGAVGQPTVVLSHELWQRRYQADPSVVGRMLMIDGAPFTVSGVLPPTFEFPYTVPSSVNLGVRVPDVFFPHTAAPALGQRGNGNHIGIGRLAPGVSLAAAQRELDGIATALAREYPAANANLRLVVTKLQDRTSGHLRPVLFTLLGAMALVLIVACVNVANLLVARGQARIHEFGVRAALGASRSALVRQLLIESALIGVAGLALGLWFAAGGLAGLLALAPGTIDRLETITLDGRVIAFSAVLAILTAFAFGMYPALVLSRTSPGGALAASGRSGQSRSEVRARRVLVVAEVAMSLVLVTVASLLIRSYQNVRAIDDGFDTEQTLSFFIQLPSGKYPTDSSHRAFFRTLTARLGETPGIEGAAPINTPPLTGTGNSGDVIPEGRDDIPQAERPEAAVRQIGPGYFDLMRIRLMAGRAFDVSDDATRPNVAIVSEELAHRLFGPVSPLGRRITVWGHTREIVGVAAGIRENGPEVGVAYAVYMPLEQFVFGGGGVVVRTTGDPRAMIEPIRGVVASLDPELAIMAARPLSDNLAALVAQRRFATMLLGCFAGIALFLAATGLSGVLAFLVGRQRREIGLRLALGADTRDVVMDVVRSGLSLAAIGIGVGTAASIVVGLAIRHFLYGVDARDPVPLLWVGATLFAVTLFATWLPARRAAAVPPIEVLRD